MKRILHVGLGLPDHRIEKYSIYSKSIGDQVYMLGLKKDSDAFAYMKTEFDGLLVFKIKPRYLFFPRFIDKTDKELLGTYISDIDPDIIHVHDIFPFHFIHTIFPEYRDRLVFDSHEYWSVQTEMRHSYGFHSGTLHRLLVKRWEANYIKNYPTITVSPSIAYRMQKQYDRHIHVIPNLPFRRLIAKTNHTLSVDNTIVFIGKVNNINYSYRDKSKLTDLFSQLDGKYQFHIYGNNPTLESDGHLINHGYVRHQDLIPSLSGYTYGLYGFKGHPFHYYTSPTRLGTFIHAGLIPIIPESMSLGMYFPFKDACVTYNRLNEIPDKLDHIRDLEQRQAKIHNLSQYYVFDNYLEVVDRVYNRVVKQ